MGIRIRQRRDTAANWSASAVALDDGEFGWSTDTFVLKIGPGLWSVAKQVFPQTSESLGLVTSEVAMPYTFLTKQVYAKVFSFSGATAGTPVTLGNIASATEIVRTGGWVGDGTTQYAVGMVGSGFGSSTDITFNTSTYDVVVNIGIATVTQGNVLIEYIK